MTERSSKSHPTLLQCVVLDRNEVPNSGLAWPFGDPSDGWGQAPQDIMENAFVFACMSYHVEAAAKLLEHGVRINAIPLGFDFAATGLHYPAREGDQSMVEFLLAHGADPRIEDKKSGRDPRRLG